MSATAVNAHVLYQQVNNKNTKLITFIINLAEQLVFTGRKTARVQRKLTRISGSRFKRAKAMSISDITCCRNSSAKKVYKMQPFKNR